MNISENIKVNRVLVDLTQGQLADKLNLTRGTIAKWEAGLAVPSLEKVIELSKVFGISLDFLVNGNSKKNYFQSIEPPVSFTYDAPAEYKIKK